jgi:Uma2 family endonuclease
MATASAAGVMQTLVEGDKLLRYLRDDVLYEVVDNQVRELPPMGVRETHLASMIFRILSNFSWSHGLGQVESEMLFLLIPPPRDLQRRPDLAYVSFARWPRGKAIPTTPAWEVFPNLVLEVVSPSNWANEIIEKIENYFEAGVERVWVVYPTVKKVYVYDSPTSVQILTRAQTLDGGTVLPGFQVPLAEIFEEPAAIEARPAE